MFADRTNAEHSRVPAWTLRVGAIRPPDPTPFLPLWGHGEPLSHLCNSYPTGKPSGFQREILIH